MTGCTVQYVGNLTVGRQAYLEFGLDNLHQPNRVLNEKHTTGNVATRDVLHQDQLLLPEVVPGI
jgi:hypothetical protein